MNDPAVTISVTIQRDSVRLAVVNIANELTEVTFTDPSARALVAESAKALCNVADIAAALDHLGGLR